MDCWLCHCSPCLRNFIDSLLQALTLGATNLIWIVVYIMLTLQFALLMSLYYIQALIEHYVKFVISPFFILAILFVWANRFIFFNTVKSVKCDYKILNMFDWLLSFC